MSATITGLGANGESASGFPLERLAIQAACIETVLNFFAALDANDNGAALNCMAEEGVWVRAGTPLQGSAAIGKALSARDPKRITAHVITNLRVTVIDAKHAVARFYLLAYLGQKGEGITASMLPAGIRDCTDELVEMDGGWRIARKTSVGTLPAPTH